MDLIIKINLFFIIRRNKCWKIEFVNLIFGEKILLFGIRVFILRVCRVKYCEQLMIFIRDNKGKELVNMLFDNVKEMVENLKMFVKINDKKISCVDIYMLVLLLQVGLKLFCSK